MIYDRPTWQPGSSSRMFHGSVGGARDVEGAGLGVDPGPPPSSLTYPEASLALQIGDTVGPYSPTVTGGPASYFTVTGEMANGETVGLPPGIALDRTTGVLSGSPTEMWDATLYRFLAWKGGNAAEYYMTIEVFDVQPPPPPPPGGIGTGGTLLTSLTAHGQQINFENPATGAPVLVGEYAYSGYARYWAVGDPVLGVKWTSKTPAYENKGQYVFKGVSYTWHKNGAFEGTNPRNATQAGDSTCYQNGSYNAPNYSHTFNKGAAMPFTTAPNRTVIFVRSRDMPFQRPQYYSVINITVLAAPPAGPDPFAPIYVNDPGGGPKPAMLYKAGDIDWSRVPNLAIPSDPNGLIPSWASIEALFDGGWFEGVNDPSTILVQFVHPVTQMLAYGRDIQSHLMTAFAKVFLAYPQAEKENTVRALVQLGLDRYQLSLWDPYQSSKALGPSGHWGQNAGQAFGAQFCILFAGLLLHDTAMINHAKMSLPYSAATTQQWQPSNQYFKVYDTADGPMFGRCGFGPRPAGASGDWVDVGQAHWAIAENEQRHQGLPTLSGGKLWDTLAPFADAPMHPRWPKQANGVPCPRGSNGTNNAVRYHQCCTSNVHWMWNLGSRVFEKMGLITTTDYFPAAMYHSMRSYIATNALWGIGSEAPPPAQVTHSENFFEQVTGPSGKVGIVKLVWGTYGTDEITYPIPVL